MTGKPIEAFGRDAETWKTIPGYPNYEASDHGNVRNAATGQLINPWIRAGYPTLALRAGGKRNCRALHTIIAETFIGSRPMGGRYHCAHLDGNPLNARANNLSWVTPSENEQHKRDHGTYSRGNWPKVRLFSVEQADLIRVIVAAGVSATDLADLIGVNISTVSSIVSGRSYQK